LIQDDPTGAKVVHQKKGKAAREAQQACLDRDKIRASWNELVHAENFEAAVGFNKNFKDKVGHFVGCIPPS
jgi:hypothetical protein